MHAVPSILLEDLTLGFGNRPAVHHLSGAVEPGTVLGVVGANGSGKSTLMKGVAGLLTPMTGRVVLARHMRVAYLPQESELDRSFPAPVSDLVKLGRWPKRGLLGRIRRGWGKAVMRSRQRQPDLPT